MSIKEAISKGSVCIFCEAEFIDGRKNCARPYTHGYKAVCQTCWHKGYNDKAIKDADGAIHLAKKPTVKERNKRGKRLTGRK